MITKLNKRYHLIYILLSCLLLFGFIFLPFQRLDVYADENYPGDNLSNEILYLYDLDTITFTGQSNTLDVQFPNAIYPDKLDYLYSNNISGYFNTHSMGTYTTSTGVNSELPPVLDFQFSANTGTISSTGNLSLFGTNTPNNVTTPLYMSECLIPLPSGYSNGSGLSTDFNGKTLPTPFVLRFNDSLVPIGRYHELADESESWLTNSELLDWKGFYFRLLNTSGNAYRLHFKVSYQYYYNSYGDLASNSVEDYDYFQLTPPITSYHVFDSNSNGVAGGMIYNPSFHTGTVTGGALNNVGKYYLICGDYDFYYRYLCNFTIHVGVEKLNSLAVNFRQISMTNYSYIVPASYDYGLLSVLNHTLIDSNDFVDFDFGSFLADSVSGFLEFELFPGFSMITLFALVLALPLTIAVLKFFAGG